MITPITHKKQTYFSCSSGTDAKKTAKRIIQKLIKENADLNTQFNELMKLFVEQKKQLIILNKATKEYLDKTK